MHSYLMSSLRTLGVLGVFLIGGCASPPLAPPSDQSATSVTVPASQVYFPGQRDKRYKDTKGGKVQVRRFTDAASDGSWTMTSADSAVIDQKPEVGVAIQVLTFVPLDDGGVGLSKVIDYGENAITTYTPPLELMPKVLGPDGWKTETDVKLTYADQPEVERSTGKASLELKIIKSEGSGKALRVTISSLLKIGLSPADVTEEEVRQVGPTGIVREHERRVVKVGFLTIERVEHQFELQE
ncbi:MAG: hypothetical protein WC718_12365 [Phycisphaerales bacterium]|jgi:hypothetical protein